MLVLTIRTDKPESELGLFKDQARLQYEIWPAHRELSLMIHQKILDVLGRERYALDDIEGIVAFAGPGSFTGLRIGLTVANALADALHVPIVGTIGEAWLRDGIDKLVQRSGDRLVLPQYGAPAHITTQRK